MPIPFSQVLAMAKQESQAPSSGMVSKGKMQTYLDVVCAEGGGVSEPMIELDDVDEITEIEQLMEDM